MLVTPMHLSHNLPLTHMVFVQYSQQSLKTPPTGQFGGYKPIPFVPPAKPFLYHFGAMQLERYRDGTRKDQQVGEDP